MSLEKGSLPKYMLTEPSWRLDTLELLDPNIRRYREGRVLDHHLCDHLAASRADVEKALPLFGEIPTELLAPTAYEQSSQHLFLASLQQPLRSFSEN